MRRILIALALLGVFAGGLGLAVIALQRGAAPTSTRTVDRFAVVQAVESVLRVATVEMHLAEVVTYRDRQSHLFHLIESEKSAVYRVQGKVLAGFDLGAGRLDVTTADGKVRVRLPHARIVAIDPVIEILNEESGWMNPVTTADRNVWYRWARADLRRAALDAKITDEAETRAAELVRALVHAYGLEAEVSFEGEIEPPAEGENVPPPTP